MASLPIHLHLLLFILHIATLASSSSISYNARESHGFPGRNLLQQKAACPVNFENENYTIITSQCKGPHYQPKPCCDSFKEIACLYFDQINDQKTDCASTLFSYINLYGKYPPGLFSSLCREGKEGLDCEDILTAKEKSSSSGSYNSPKKSGENSSIQSSHFVLMITTTFSSLLVLLLFSLF